MTGRDRILYIWIVLAAWQVGLLAYNAITARDPGEVALGAGTLALAVGMIWFWGRKRR